MDNEPINTNEYGFCGVCGETVRVMILPEDRAQARVALAVAKRGYRRGWSGDQFLGRQLAKMMEELGEAGAHLAGCVPFDLMERLQNLADQAKMYFDTGNPQDWGGYLNEDDFLSLADELADMQVVLFNMASVLGELAGEPLDVVKMALEKAERDVARGVRKA